MGGASFCPLIIEAITESIFYAIYLIRSVYRAMGRREIPINLFGSDTVALCLRVDVRFVLLVHRLEGPDGVGVAPQVIVRLTRPIIVVGIGGYEHGRILDGIFYHIVGLGAVSRLIIVIG